MEKKGGFGPAATSVVSLDDPTSTTTAELEEKLAIHGLERDLSGLLQWKKDSTDHPRNWSMRRKIYDTTVIILLEFYTTVISTTGASASDFANYEYNVDKRVALVAFTFMYQFGQAIGGCLMPPFSESFGRRNVYIYSCAIFSLSSLLVGVVDNFPLVFFSRFIAGFASAVPSVVIAGSVEDIFNSKMRVWVVVVWNAATTAGLCFGPIYAAYIAEAFGWRWVFNSAAFVTAAMFLAILGIKESRPSRIMLHKIRTIKHVFPLADLRFENPDSTPDLRTVLEVVLLRPVELLFTEPLVMIISIISAISWGIIYLFTESLTRVYATIGFSKEQSSLPFLAMAIGVLFTFLPRFWDMKIVKERRKQNVPVEPEDKMIGFNFAAPTLAIGLFWFAWTVPPQFPHLHWMVPTMSLLFVGFGVNEMAYTLSGYLADAYLLYAASAFSGLAFVRAMVSGVMPLIAHEMYGKLNANVAGSILAGVTVAFCTAPIVFSQYSRSLRAKSKFARYSLEVHLRTQVEAD